MRVSDDVSCDKIYRQLLSHLLQLLLFKKRSLIIRNNLNPIVQFAMATVKQLNRLQFLLIIHCGTHPDMSFRSLVEEWQYYCLHTLCTHSNSSYLKIHLKKVFYLLSTSITFVLGIGQHSIGCLDTVGKIRYLFGLWGDQIKGTDITNVSID